MTRAAQASESSAGRRLGIALLGMLLCACTEAGSGRTGSSPASTAAAVPALRTLCVDLRLAAPYLEGIRDHSINGERLVDGLGDSAAQLKDDVRALRAAGRNALASALDRYEHALTDLRIAAQAVELQEAAGTSAGPAHEDADAERDLERDLSVLASLSDRMRPMLPGTACGG